MSSLRLKRLQADYEAVRRLAHLHPLIEVEEVEGNPPEKYRLQISVRSLREKEGRVVVAKLHRVEIALPLTYPRDPPLSRMLTPVFHPNIAPHAICVGDDWSAAESLDNLIQRIGEILSFQSYNVKSPLNGQAARWVEENEHRLPIDPEEFFLDLEDAPEPPPEPQSRACSNCGARNVPFETCMEDHDLCPDCVDRCPTCGRLMCLVCGTARCPECSEPICGNCGRVPMPALRCEHGHVLCENCAFDCEKCGESLCMLCSDFPEHDCVPRSE